MNPEFWLQLAVSVMGAVAAGAGVYAAIRSDLTRSIVTAEQAAAAATKAHDRLDVHVQNHHC